MELVFENQGLSHISNKILKSLDFKSLTALRLVCKSANNQVEDLALKITLEDLQLLLKKFAEARSMFLNEKKLWNNFLNYIFNHWSKSINNWPGSNCFMNLYLKEIFSRDNQRSRRSWRWKQTESPIFEFVRYGNRAMVEFILYYELHPIDKYEIGILLQEVDSCGHKDICEIFENFKISNPAPSNSPNRTPPNSPQ